MRTIGILANGRVSTSDRNFYERRHESGKVAASVRTVRPALVAVIHSFDDSRSFGHKVALGQHIGIQCVDMGCRFFLTYSPAIFVDHLQCLPFRFVQPANWVRRMLGRLAFVRRV